DKKYRPVFISENAITLSDKVQLVIRFYGTPAEIHDNYDYAHCMCYFDLSVSLTGYPPGNYYVKVYRMLPLIDPNTQIFIGATTFTYGGSSLAYTKNDYQSNCYQINDLNETYEKIEQFELAQNFPNPFNPTTKISWQSPVSSWLTIKVFDVLGNEIATLVNEFSNAGRYEVEFKAEGLPSGLYFYKLQAGSFTQTRKMILLK
nr:T9SS type A sorting domain-containing protein [Ignavibacterium sp.]